MRSKHVRNLRVGDRIQVQRSDGESWEPAVIEEIGVFAIGIELTFQVESTQQSFVSVFDGSDVFALAK